LLDPISPNLVDVLESPGTTVLRSAGEPVAGHLALALAIPERSFLIGSQMGGPGAYLALGAIALPLALALTLQLIAPRGSRESLSARLASSGHTSLVALLSVMILASALVIGMIAGPLFSLPYAFALMLAGLPSARSSGLRWTAAGLTFLCLATMGGGVALGEFWAASTTYPAPVEPLDARATARIWSDSLPIVRDFPLMGTGLGTFASVYPYYKTRDASATTASSSLLQWWVETGAVGMILLAAAGLWIVWRLPGAIRRVGTADRALAFGLIGAASGFTLYSVVHWTVELASVALAASAVAGTLNRWLAGGTDLFVERG
jgi:O-antigen ligase